MKAVQDVDLSKFKGIGNKRKWTKEERRELALEFTNADTSEIFRKHGLE